MAATQKQEAPQGLTLEKVWEYFYANVEENAKRQAEWEQRQVEADKQWTETKAEIGRLSKNIGNLGNSVGRLIETLVAARLWEKFAGHPYNLNRAYQRLPVYDENRKTVTDIDILLVDGEWAMAVEVKNNIETSDVARHLERMEQIRKYPQELVMGKKLLGAVAGGVVDASARRLAHESGFFVLELKGEAVDLVPSPDGFVPGEW